MNLLFWKKPRRIPIPAEHVRKVRELDDAFQTALVGDRVAHYDCWKFIALLVPETRTGKWTLKFPDAFSAEVVERL